MSPPDLVVLGRVATLGGRHGAGWVEGIAIGGGRGVAAGHRPMIAGPAGPRTRTIDLAPDGGAMPGLTDALFVVDSNKEDIAVKEARKMGIPVVAVVDTNCDPDLVDYVIPGNDDALRAIRLFASRISDAALEGRRAAEEKLLEAEKIAAEKAAEELEAQREAAAIAAVALAMERLD